MIACITETVDTCIVCGLVCCERDLLCFETQQEAAGYDAEVDDLICRDCAGEE